MNAKHIIEELVAMRNPEKEKILLYFFKTGKGQYGEGDQFLGITVPQIRSLVKKYKDISIHEIETLIHNQFHECRMLALLLLVESYPKAKSESEQKQIYEFYIRQVDYINNWDLVDLTAPHIVGAYLWGKDREDLFNFAQTPHLWLQRIAVIATYYFIRKHDFQTTFDVSTLLLQHPHDLIHKAVGWMLREAGKRDFEAEYQYLLENKRYQSMPRTMLRYAIEKFPESLRQDFLKGRVG